MKKSLVCLAGSICMLFGCGPSFIDTDINEDFLAIQRICSFTEEPPSINLNDRSDLIAWVQERLIDYGYLSSEYLEKTYWDGSPYLGKFDKPTRLALASFQGWQQPWKGMPPDIANPINISQRLGTVDLATLCSLEKTVPKTPNTGRARLQGGVSLANMTDPQLVEYLMGYFQKAKCNPNAVEPNRMPEGVNFVQIRGFDPIDRMALQNINNEFNDALFVLTNASECEPGSCEPDPEKLVVLEASADYGKSDYYLGEGFGYARPYWITQQRHLTLGISEKKERGLLMTAANQVVLMKLGRHLNAGLALLDPYDDQQKWWQGYVDFNQDFQIDGLELEFRVGLAQRDPEGKPWVFKNPITGEEIGPLNSQNSYMGTNFHRARRGDTVGNSSAGCHTLPVDNGTYQKFTKILLESGQVTQYLAERFDDIEQGRVWIRGPGRTRANSNGILYYENAEIPHIDSKYADGENPYEEGSEVFLGPEESNGILGIDEIRFPVLLLDSRELSLPRASHFEPI